MLMRDLQCRRSQDIYLLFCGTILLKPTLPFLLYCDILVSANFEVLFMGTKAKERGLFVLGVAICLALAGVAVLLEKLIPGGLLGAR